jgi:Bifunctional DNA primase/polymerase, N-terminal/Primase C terminal 1 (PriCT-1)
MLDHATTNLITDDHATTNLITDDHFARCWSSALAAINDMSPRDAGHGYADLGFRVLWLRAKIPAYKGGAGIATTDHNALNARYRPGLVPGLATGYGLHVIDVDAAHGGRVDPAWPDTTTASSPSHELACHKLYACPEAIAPSTGRLAVGVDVKGRSGNSGHVALPCAGTGRAWIDVREPARMPAWLVAACRAAASGGFGRRAAGDSRAAGRAPFQFRERVSEGGRNNYLAAAAGKWLSLGNDEDDLEAWLLAHNATVCVPALDLREVQHVAASIGRLHRDSA